MATSRKSKEVKQFTYIDSESQVLFQESSQNFFHLYLQKRKNIDTVNWQNVVSGATDCISRLMELSQL